MGINLRRMNQALKQGCTKDIGNASTFTAGSSPAPHCHVGLPNLVCNMHCCRRPYPCSHCGRSFDSPQALQQHMDAAHPAHTSTYAAQAAQPAVVNAMLGLMAATYISPNQRTTSVPVASSSTTTPRTSSTGPQVHCVMCGHKYDSAEQLWNHMRLTHQRFMCRCGGCSKSFTSQDALAAHVQEKHRS
jgi:DNA-directed RNA polymerase subunit RPC12/RpoP